MTKLLSAIAYQFWLWLRSPTTNVARGFQTIYRLGWLGTQLTLASHFRHRAWSRAQLSHRDPHWIGPDIIPGGVPMHFLTPLRLQSY